jgi:hypothetical protein
LRVIGVSPLREALRSRPDLLVDTRRLAVKTDARVAPGPEGLHVGAQYGEARYKRG